MTGERILKYILIVAGTAAALFLFPFLWNAFSPFIASFFIATLCQNMVKFLEKKFRISRGISSAVIVTLFVAVVLGVIVLGVSQLIVQAKNLITALPDAISSLRTQISFLSDSYNGMRGTLPPETIGVVDSIMGKFEQYAFDISEKVTGWALDSATNFAMALPNILFFVIMLILGTFFFIKDYQLVINFFRELFPQRVTNFVRKIRKIAGKAFSSYLKAQLHLMLITSFLVTVCLWIIGKENALLWGIICGLVDALPILGTATVLIPWAIVSFAFGDMYSFVALLIVEVLVFVVRELAEPKVISRNIGVHPILTLVSIYIGLRFFGIIGVILAPIVTILCVNLYVTYKEKG